MRVMTHYKTLGIDHNASADLIEFTYQERLKDAKDKLQNSPLFFEKQRKLEHAYQVLSSPTLRKAYDHKLIKEKTTIPVACPDKLNVSSSLSSVSGLLGLHFSKSFIVSVVLVILFFALLRYNEFRVMHNAREQEMSYYNKMRDQQLYEQQQRVGQYYSYNSGSYERKNTSNQYGNNSNNRYMDMQEQNASARRARDARRLAMQEERESQRAKYEARRQRDLEKTRKRHAEYEANKLSRETIRRIERTGELQRDINRLKAGL
jgi:curved DNA-binding protein CbpA